MCVSPQSLTVLLPVQALSTICVRAVARCRSMLHEHPGREAVAGAYPATSMDSRQWRQRVAAIGCEKEKGRSLAPSLQSRKETAAEHSPVLPGQAGHNKSR